MIKKIKNYWNKQPCNIKHSNKKFLSKEYFNEITKKKYFVENHIPQFADFKNYKKKNVLEIGCGIGTDAIQFIKNGSNYIGTDVSDKSIAIAKKRVEVFNLMNHKSIFIEDNCEKLIKVKKYLKKNKIRLDLIYSFGVIHHTNNMKKVFDEIYKIANKNTLIKIMLYAKNSYKSFLLDHTNYRFERQKNCPVVHTIDNNELKKLIGNKFKITKQYQDFIFPYKIKPYKKNKYIKIDHFRVMPKKIFDVLKGKIGEHLLIELKKK